MTPTLRALAMFAAVAVATLKPRTRLNTWQWSEIHVYLDARFTHRPGLFEASFTPYIKLLHEWFSDPYVTEITFEKPRQVAGTTFLANCMMYVVGENPGPVLYVTSTQANAQSFAEREWLPRVELCDLLRSLKPDDDDDYKKTEQHFKSCTVKFAGAQSVNNLMSRPIQYLFEDEVDTWPEDNGAEAPSMEIAEACTISYGHAKKIVRVSTPTVPTGAIHKAAEQGSKHRLLVLSPFAPTKPRFELKFELLNLHKEKNKDDKTGRWNLDRVRASVTLTCPHTNKEIPMSMRSGMIEEACENNIGWVATNPDAPSTHKSAQISALYSPLLSWGDIAVLFLQKKDAPGGLHDFYNHYLGVPWERKQAEIKQTDIEVLRDMSPVYHRPDLGAMVHKLPFDLNCVLMMVDVQQGGFWWGHSGLRVCQNKIEHYVLDWGPCVSFLDIEKNFDRVYLGPGGEKLRSIKGLMDSGYAAKRTAGVYEFCLSMDGDWFPAQGRVMANSGMLAPVRETIFDYKGSAIEAIQFRDDLAKEELYIRRIKERKAALYLPQEIDVDLIQQWMDEKLVTRKTERGTENLEWKDGGNNHLGDVFKIGIVGEWLLTDILLNPDGDGGDDPEAQDGEPDGDG